MSVVFEPEFEALWHMFAEDSTTVAEKNRALLVGGAYFYQVLIPAVTMTHSSAHRCAYFRGW